MAAKRRSNKSSAGFALLPWLGLLFGCAVYFAMRWMLPSMAVGNPQLAGLAASARSFAWLPPAVFGLFAVGSLARSLQGAGKVDRDTHRRKRRSWRDTSVNISRIAFRHGWGVTKQRVPKPDVQTEEFGTWTLATLRALEWKRFELLCAQYYEAAGFRCDILRCGSDGGIDMKLFKSNLKAPLAVVHCKSWNVYSLGVRELRELLALMTHEKAARGVFITTSSFNKDALTFAADHPIQLLDGESLLRKILALPKATQDAMLKLALQGDYKTPTCPSCGTRMVKRSSEHGPFWGCLNSPRCKNTFAMRG
jgi:restriction system protein